MISRNGLFECLSLLDEIMMEIIGLTSLQVFIVEMKVLKSLYAGNVG